MSKQLLPKPSPKRLGREAPCQACFFSVLNSREDSIRITSLQPLLAPHQAQAHVHIHISQPYTGMSPHLLRQPHTPGEKDIYAFLHYFPSCNSNFYRRLFLSQQNNMHSSFAQKHVKNLTHGTCDFLPNLWLYSKASPQSVRN